MFKFNSSGFMRVVSLGVCLGVVGLLSACAAPSDAPEPSATATTAAVPASPTKPAAAAPSAPASPTTAAAAAPSAPASAPGNVQSVRLDLVTGESEARYRVREQLARVSFPSDAVGSTKAVTGTVVANADGSIVTAVSRFQVDLSTLRSDEGQRDNFIKMNTLQTNSYRYAVFVPTKVEGLALPPTAGPVSFKLTGDLTIRNVTKPVTWDVKGTITGDEAKGTATTSFTFAYFNLEKPNVFTVLSVEDTIKLELDLRLKRVVAP